MAKLVLCKGVELEPNYEHTFDFANATEQGSYFSSKAYKTYDTFLRIKDRNASLFKGIIAKENYDYLKVDESIDEVRQCTYLYWQDDASLLTPSKIYYAFITNSYYVNDNCTIVEYELDVMQTFLFDYQIESAYIAREHQDRMYKNVSDNKYYPIYNIQPEELNLGKTYYMEDINLLSCAKDYEGKPLLWLVIVSSESLYPAESAEYNSDTPSKYDVLKSLYIYLVPFIASNKAPTTRSIYYTNSLGNDVLLTNVTQVMQNFCKDSRVHQMYILPHIPFEDTLTFTNASSVPHHITISHNSNRFLSTIVVGDYVFLKFNQPNDMQTKRGEIKIGEVSTNAPITLIPSTNVENSIRYETKLLTHPFRKIELQVDNNITELYNEFIKSNDIISIINFYATTSQLYYNKNYNQNDAKASYGLRNNVVSKSVNDIPVVTDPYLQYILTKNAQVQTGLAVKGITSGIGILASGFGTMTGAINPVVGLAGVALSLTNISGAVAQENAKQEDLKNTPDNIELQGNDGMFGNLSFSCIPTLYYLSIREEYLKQAYSYFRLFGYKANRLATPIYNGQGTITSDNMNLKSRYYYNYIKCADINIELAYNRDYHDKIIAIFKNGITFWHYRSDTMTASTFKPFNYRYENIEVSLLS